MKTNPIKRITEKRMLEVINNFLKSKSEESFSNAVRGKITASHKKATNEQLEHMADLLLEWAGKRLWELGYEFDDGKDIEWDAKRSNYGKNLGVAITIYGKFSPRLKQFCYQFLMIADKAKEQIEELKLEIKRLQSVHLAMMFKYNKEWDWASENWVETIEGDEDDY